MTESTGVPSTTAEIRRSAAIDAVAHLYDGLNEPAIFAIDPKDGTVSRCRPAEQARAIYFAFGWATFGACVALAAVALAGGLP